jgi:chemotaxis protein methyltransferase CheR
MIPINDADFKKLTEFIKNTYGINLTQKRTLIEGRLSNIIFEKGFESFSDYLDFVFGDVTGDETIVLINKLTTNHTYFMRESNHFDYLRETVLPYLASTIKDRDLRLWSAGCSSGEEPYTLEIILREYFGGGVLPWDTQILATDISNRALELAKKGIYAADAIDSIPKLWKLNYFEKIDAENYRISESIKKNIIFRIFNLMQPEFPFKKKFHVIFCRNVMIYFDQPTKDALINKFYEFTEPGGYLFIGHSESVSRESSKYKYIMPAVYRKV